VFEGKKITVLGAGKSGTAAALLALRLGAEVCISDSNPNVKTINGVHNLHGCHPDEILAVDIVVVSPGIPAASAVVRRARELAGLVCGELAFAWAVLVERGIDQKPVVAITGTNGKSTVTSFTGDLIRATGRKVFVGGNLGTPLSDACGQDWDAFVIEVSSYQMELPGEFAPNVACILNLSPDHLARHKSIEIYAQHKCRLLQAVPVGGVTVRPKHDAVVERNIGVLSGLQLRFDEVSGACVVGDKAYVLGVEVEIAEVQRGITRWNAAAAALLAVSAGIDVRELNFSALRSLSHRMEVVGSALGMRWINDSKATNVEATLAGISEMAEGTVVLLGGAGKEGADYSPLQSRITECGGKVVCFGAAGPDIAKVLSSLRPILVKDMASAIEAAKGLARDGGDVILSPACASFDEFDNFAQRGDRFAELVGSLDGFGEVA